MHKFPVADGGTSVNRKDYVHHQFGTGRLESLRKIKVSLNYYSLSRIIISISTCRKGIQMLL